MLNFLNLDQFKKGLTPVTSTELWSKPGEFHQDGLFSEIIFGAEESSDRKKIFSYINLNTQVIHPIVLSILTRLNRKVQEFISAQETFSLDSNGEIQVDPKGITGISNFIKIFPEIKFKGGTSDRDKFIKKINLSYKDKSLFIDIIPIIPPDHRPAYQDEKGMLIIDPLNDIYISIIRKAFQVKSTSKSGPLFDLLNFELQRAILNHDEFIKNRIQKKHGIIRSSLLGKRTDFSARAVITPGPDLKVNEIGVPLRIAVSLFEPFLIHRLFRSGRVDQVKLAKYVKSFTGLELSIDSIKVVFKAIKAGDKIPDNLYKIIFDSTQVVMKDRIVLSKRDPVLHAESVRGFKPILVTGNTLKISTLQVGGFNADFDGDSNYSIISIIYKDGSNKVCHIKDLEVDPNFRIFKKIEKTNEIIVTKYKPLIDIYIRSIQIETGEIRNKKILEYSKHENIKMYKIHDKKNRFEDFWSSYDHSLIIYDEIANKIKKISPKELLENPEGKFFIKDRKYERIK